VASLKDLRNRINSVRSTRKITQAMKMVAAAKLRRAQEQAEAARPYAERMQRMLAALSASVAGQPGVPKLLSGTGQDETYLIVLCTSDRGLCGAFNSNLAKETRRRIDNLRARGKTVKVLCVGRKGRDQLRRTHGSYILPEASQEIGRTLNYDTAREIAEKITDMFDGGEFDVCQLVYARFRSPIKQIVTTMQLVPSAAKEEPAPGEQLPEDMQRDEGQVETGRGGSYEFEPAEAEILAELLPRNMATQVFRALLENSAGEQGARMTAMDGATRNADDMIDSLTLTYNRTRQAVITKELNEIVSAKEALQ
jgi:F-type H+-transporting ATPase subunit gamma